MNQITLTGAIGWDSAINLRTIQVLVEAMDDGGTINLDSGGGEVYEAISIYEYLKPEVIRKNITCVVTGICASSATIILAAFPLEQRKATESDRKVMFHLPNVEFRGNIDQFSDSVERANQLQYDMFSVYEAGYGIDADSFTKLLMEDREDVWLSSSEAVSLGIFSEIVTVEVPETSGLEVTASVDFNRSKPTNMSKKKSFFERLTGAAASDEDRSKDIEVTDAAGNVYTIKAVNGIAAIGDEVLDKELKKFSGELVSQEGQVFQVSEAGTITSIAIKDPEEESDDEGDSTDAEQQAAQQEAVTAAIAKQINAFQEMVAGAFVEMDKKFNARVTALEETNKSSLDKMKALVTGKHIPDPADPDKKVVPIAGAPTINYDEIREKVKNS